MRYVMGVHHWGAMQSKYSILALGIAAITLATPASGAPVVAVTVVPAVLNFGNATVGANTSATQQVTITNASPSTVTISALPITGSGAGSFAFGGVTLPIQLATTASVSVPIAFTPASAGSETASLGITATSAGQAVGAGSVSLSGTGVSLTMGFGISSLAYGSVLDDPSSPPTQTFTMTNAGTGNLTVSGISVSGGGGEFSATTAPSIPFTLTPSQTAAVAVTFNPLVGGPATGQVSIVSNATNSPSVISLTGTGIHWVSLNWTPSASPEIIFYNVYEGTVSGGPYIRLGSLTGTTYEDGEPGIAPESTRYYVVTAVDSTGLESSYSNEAAVLIPTTAFSSSSARMPMPPNRL